MQKKKNKLRRSIDRFEKSFITYALKKCDWNISETARYLEVHRKHIWRKMKSLNIPSREEYEKTNV